MITMKPPLIEVSRSFQAMNTGVELVVCLPEDQKSNADSALTSVQNLFHEVETRLSRFLAESELSQLNRSAGQTFKASDWLFEIMSAALRSAELTGGIFDPSILPSLISAGYDRSFETIPVSRCLPSADHALYQPSWQAIKLDPQTRSVFLPVGCSIDLGGIAKGWTVDRAGYCLARFYNFAVNAGGDILVGGTQSEGSPWSVGIEDPFNLQPNLLILYLSGLAVCTSSIAKRKWLLNGIYQHHLIDPRTGLPATSGIVAATVIAGSAVLAETLSKSALILGPSEGLRLVESRPDVAGMLILEDESRLTSRGFSKYSKLRHSWS
jgi:FAD:protein FMN transferase